MPCLNEAETLEICLKKAHKCLTEHDIAYEIIVADNGSTDGSIAIAERNNAKVVHVKEKGYGHALFGGISAANSEYVIMGDCDDSYNFLGLMPFIDQLRQGYDLVMGNRFQGGIDQDAMPKLHRYFGNPFLSFIGRLFFNSNLGDFYCGLRGFRKDAFEKMKVNSRGMEFALEMVVKSTIYNLKIKEIPTTLSPDGRSRKPHLRTFRDGWRSLRFFLLYSPRWLFLIPGLILFIVGSLLSVALIFSRIEVMGAVLDVHTLLFAHLAALLGMEMVFFYVFAKVYAVTNNFLPESKTYDTIRRIFTLEKGLVIGLVILLSGLGLSGYSFFSWSDTGFGELDYTNTMRLVMPAVLLIAMGFQMILYSFFLSILSIKK